MKFEAKHVETATIPSPNSIHNDTSILKFEIPTMLLRRENVGSGTHTPSENVAMDDSSVATSNPTQEMGRLGVAKRMCVLFLWTDTVVLTLAAHSRTSTS